MENVEKKHSWIDHKETYIFYIALGGIFFTLVSMIYGINSRIDNMNSRFDNMNSRFDDYIKAWHQESITFQQRWADESKDFHGRLIAIEERNKK